jgi:hypothetical protein
MVHDHHVRAEETLPRLLIEAAGIGAAGLRCANMLFTAHQRPHMRIRLHGKIGEGAVFRRLRPFPDPLDFRLLRRREQLAAVAHGALQPKRAQIIPAPFPKHDLEFHRQNLLQDRNVLVHELLLQIDRVSRNDRLLLHFDRPKNGRNQIGERFSDPRSRLHHQMPLRAQGLRYRHGHLLLLQPVFEIPGFREQTGLGKYLPHFFGKAGGAGMFTQRYHEPCIIIAPAIHRKHRRADPGLSACISDSLMQSGASFSNSRPLLRCFRRIIAHTHERSESLPRFVNLNGWAPQAPEASL